MIELSLNLIKSHINDNCLIIKCLILYIFFNKKLRQPRGKSLESLEDPDENRLSGTTHLTFTTGGAVAYHPQHSHYSSGGALHGDSGVNLYRASIGGGQYQMVNKSNLHQMVNIDTNDRARTSQTCYIQTLNHVISLL